MDKATIKAKRGPAAKKKIASTIPVKRFGFTIEKDINILKEAININPWQLGHEKWSQVVQNLKDNHGYSLGERSIKERINRLAEKLEKEQLIQKTGTEEQNTERGDLVKEAINIMKETEATIQNMIGVPNHTQDDILEENEVNRVLNGESDDDNDDNNGRNERQRIRNERRVADQERNNAVNNIPSDPHESNIRRKKARLTVEDEMIRIKQEHDMKMEILKLEMEDKLENRKLDMERSRLNIEREKLMHEEKKEERIMEENKRRDELQSTQLNIHRTFMEVIKDLINKK